MFDTNRPNKEARRGKHVLALDADDETMKLLSNVGLDIGYGEATGAHLAASASALTELARLASAHTVGRDARRLCVRLSHFEHGAFLNLQLFGFWVLLATGEVVTPPTPPGMEDSPPSPAAGLRSPDLSSPEQPAVYAVVANHSVPVQIEHTLATLAMLVARQEFVGAGIGDVVTEIDRLTADLDTRAVNVVTDTLRTHGWRAAAEAVRIRSEVAGLPLSVTYDSVLLNNDDLALRAPILRRVYNEIPAVRLAVDKVATMLSQGLTVVGDGSERVAAFARDLLDIGSSRTYLAHLARDGLVCGNGYLSFGAAPDEDIRLLQPEQVGIVGRARPGTVNVTLRDTGAIHKSVLHMTGAEQRDSPYGLSILEPFVYIQHGREAMLDLIKIAEVWDRPDVPEQYRSEALERIPMARRVLSTLESRTVALLGGPGSIRIQPPEDLYFSGHEQMAPAAEALTMVAAERDAQANVGEQA